MIIKEIAELTAKIKTQLGVKSDKVALDLAVRIQKNRLLKDLTDYLKNNK